MDVQFSLYFMASLYILGGIMHYIKPKIYLRIMPQYLPWHKELVFLSGVAEVLCGLGLFWVATRNLALYGIIVLLWVFLLVHFHMLSNKKAAAGVPKWVLIARLPLQFFLMYWAYAFLL
ncbi:MAG: hypothetical protein KC471_08055 [Flavobacteriaceae bacterium]|jgi:uncharacterized membrane protein|nr:MAG: hypothetical protein ABR91_03945 [Polaribacter sp. BACL8 MAG-120531-bin13]KRP01452.1 MAG: hypothetical protein ABR92_08020 [Polaribacter sp. BACL8 MAG-120619-bin41]MBT4840323.1 hypothetical protein [Flavobacteriaceae bacterium]MDA9304257.1 hypothetical protein [bacterium]NQV62194.1 hypothetical protein [Cryomorphaceae bacterium]